DNSGQDEEDEVHTTTNVETDDTSVPKSSSPKSSQIQELTNQLNELLVKSLKIEFSKILSFYDFNTSLPTELKDLPSKFNELAEEVKGLKKQVHELDIELPGDLKDIPTKLEDITKTVASVQAKLKTLDALPSLLLNVTKALNKFAQLFQKRAEKNAEKENLNNQQQKVPPIITTTIQMQTPVQNIPKSSSQPEGEHIKKDKGKKAIIKKLKRFDLITKDGRHIHLTKEQINHQKKLKEDAIAEAAKQEGEVRKAELVDLLGPKVVNKYYNDKLQKGPITLKVYRENGTSEIIPNFKASDLHLGEWREVVEACPNKTRKGWKTIYDQIKSRMDYLHTTKAELGINLDIPLSKQDPLDKLNDLANKRKHADDIHDYFKANKKLKQDFVTIKDLKDFSNTMLYTVQEIFFRRHQFPRLDDHARTFSSLLLAEVDKRNPNSLKQIRTIEQLRQ
ncbi:hypothetical protein Tco_0436135, partial [Tanacetum coccineum]